MSQNIGQEEIHPGSGRTEFDDVNAHFESSPEVQKLRESDEFATLAAQNREKLRFSRTSLDLGAYSVFHEAFRASFPVGRIDNSIRPVVMDFGDFELQYCYHIGDTTFLQGVRLTKEPERDSEGRYQYDWQRQDLENIVTAVKNFKLWQAFQEAALQHPEILIPPQIEELIENNKGPDGQNQHGMWDRLVGIVKRIRSF